MKNNKEKIAIVIVNWNGWGDTIECLQSIYNQDSFEAPIIVIDNSSTDGSAEKITHWANYLICAVAENKFFNPIVNLRSNKEQYIFNSINNINHIEPNLNFSINDSSLILLNLNENIGFAGANNIGITLLKNNGYKSIWFINNDTVIEKNCFNVVKKVIQDNGDKFIIFGNSLLEYWQPDKIQAIGGKYNLYTGTSSHIDCGKTWVHESNINLKHIDYPIGAGMIVNIEYFNKFGLMSTDYFLYYEEIDLLIRSGWPSNAFCIVNSIIYHKGGKSTKGNSNLLKRSLISDYYMIRGRIIFSNKLPILKNLITKILLIVTLVKRLKSKKHFKNCLVAIIDGIRGIRGRKNIID